MLISAFADALLLLHLVTVCICFIVLQSLTVVLFQTQDYAQQLLLHTSLSFRKREMVVSAGHVPCRGLHNNVLTCCDPLEWKKKHFVSIRLYLWTPIHSKHVSYSCRRHVAKHSTSVKSCQDSWVSTANPEETEVFPRGGSRNWAPTPGRTKGPSRHGRKMTQHSERLGLSVDSAPSNVHSQFLRWPDGLALAKLPKRIRKDQKGLLPSHKQIFVYCGNSSSCSSSKRTSDLFAQELTLKYSPLDRKRLCNHQAVPICRNIKLVFNKGGRQYLKTPRVSESSSVMHKTHKTHKTCGLWMIMVPHFHVPPCARCKYQNQQHKTWRPHEIQSACKTLQKSSDIFRLEYTFQGLPRCVLHRGYPSIYWNPFKHALRNWPIKPNFVSKLRILKLSPLSQLSRLSALGPDSARGPDLKGAPLMVLFKHQRNMAWILHRKSNGKHGNTLMKHRYTHEYTSLHISTRYIDLTVVVSTASVL